MVKTNLNNHQAKFHFLKLLIPTVLAFMSLFAKAEVAEQVSDNHQELSVILRNLVANQTDQQFKRLGSDLLFHRQHMNFACERLAKIEVNSCKDIASEAIRLCLKTKKLMESIALRSLHIGISERSTTDEETNILRTKFKNLKNDVKSYENLKENIFKTSHSIYLCTNSNFDPVFRNTYLEFFYTSYYKSEFLLKSMLNKLNIQAQ